MKSETIYLLKFLEQRQQLTIPIYQRKYNWNLKECEKLFEDILKIGNESQEKTHFLGSVVCIGGILPGLVRLSLIDGQQRLTTVSLLISALVDYLKKNINENVNYDKLISYYLINEKENGNDKYKLILTQEDKKTLKKIIDNVSINDKKLKLELKKEDSKRLVDNFNFFKERINSDNVETIYNGLEKLIIVYIGLEIGKDNPQLIFESLNSTGLELNQADLIRNYILMGLNEKEQKALYEKYWQEMEKEFEHNENAILFDNFIRNYLTIKLGRIPTFKNIYHDFKLFSIDFKEDIEVLLKDIYKYASYYFKIVFDKENNDISNAFKSLNELKYDVVHPFLLEVYRDYIDEKITDSDLIEIVQLLESYLFRRVICDIPSPSLNKTFATLYKQIDKEDYMDSFKAILILKDSYRRFPNNNEFEKKFLFKDVYNLRNRNYLLGKLENYNVKEYINVESYTIEHIMPQNPNLPTYWKKSLGENWKEIQKKYLHTIGNLTLTGYNSELSDKSFICKRDDNIGGFKKSPINLNKYLSNLDDWNEETIVNRSKKLFKRANDIWFYPDLDKTILENYIESEEKKKTQEYTLADHQYVQKDQPMGFLFEELRKRILNIDAEVKEEPKKLYIAYKTTTNFVDIIPQKKALRILLVIPFNKIEDPKSKVRDVTGIGKWGNGNGELKIKSFNDLDYALYLIKQAFDFSLSN